MTYAQAIQFLYDLQLFGAKFGLDSTFQLAARAGHPQKRLRFIHVAGTNGKGSTCAMLESIYRAAGLRVGLFTSPHLVHFAERIQVNRQPVSEADIVRLVGELMTLLKDASLPAHPTFFEVVTVMALKYFAEQQCDLVIWETGLGGRLDATNIVTPLASVITNVQWDHEQWLGDTLSKIAFEKAGIIKPGLAVVTAIDEPDALDVVVQAARARGSPLTIVTRAETKKPPLNKIELPLLGEHQRLNAALALAVVRALAPRLPVPESCLSAGLSHLCWPGRLQVVNKSARQTLLLDGAHNPAGAATLAAALRQHFPENSIALILGMFRDKDWEEIVRLLAPLAEQVFPVRVNSARSAIPEIVAALCRQANPNATVEACGSLREAIDRAHAAALVVITGSLHFVGEAMETLALSRPAPGDERVLNEWTRPRTVTRG